MELQEETPLWAKSAAELATGYRAGAFSPTDVLEEILNRIRAVNSAINAVVTLNEQGAREAASASQLRFRASEPLGQLDGIPMTIKDSVPVAGIRTTWGSRLYADHVPAADDLAVSRLRAGGAVILGMSNCPEFTLHGYTDNLVFGTTRNPWDLALTPGGSSGGAAAAVASGLGPVAIGTDAGGSVRRPSSYTGLVGLKPSLGRVPRMETFPAILPGLEVVGPMARTVADLIAVMETISVSDPRDPASALFAHRPFAASKAPRCRILYVPQFAGAPVDPEISGSVAAAANALSELDHDLEEGDVPFDIGEVESAWPVVSRVGLAWLLESHAARRRFVGPALQEMALEGAGYSATRYFAACDTINAMRKQISVLFAEYDLILTPTAAAMPWPAEMAFPPTIAGQKAGPRSHAVFTGFVNMDGGCAISIPCSPAGNGLPIGFQLVAARGGDELLCSIAAQFEAARPWTHRRPPM